VFDSPSSDAPPRPFPACIRCGDAPAVDELDYCGHCHWVVSVEIEEGLSLLAGYLSKWRRYVDWCDEHGLVA
jgi:hypothetical protein